MPGAVYRIRGRVQGVGFRPTVFRVATDLGLTGDVRNDGSGVHIRLFGEADRIDAFPAALEAALPPLAVVESIARDDDPAGDPPAAFTIVESLIEPSRTRIAPDIAACPSCVADVFDPDNRRYRYPFTTCTDCGPRFSIATAVPFDRARTTMDAFPMCDACRAEYEDPSNRRHHAQTNACAACGPRVWLETDDGAADAAADPIAAAAALIQRGGIVAVKGLGGFQLACDATDAAAVARLRARKRRPHKPLALMARDLATIARYGQVSDEQRRQLTSPAAPIVLVDLDRNDDGETLPPEVAPEQDKLGFMLPTTPLHHLLMEDMDGPIVLTSGNASEEPPCLDNDAARQRLAGIADAWLMHDRAIALRVDDSVVDTYGRAIRRSRGFAPDPLPLPDGFPDAPSVLAMGGDLKNAFALARGGAVTLSAHIGSLDDATTFDDDRNAINRMLDVYAMRPELVAVDLHPDYASSRWGRRLADAFGVPAVGIQHHHAHVAACLAEHGRAPDAPPVLGIVLDGLGYGEDDRLRGAEFMQADYRGFVRLAAFPAVPLIGGNRAAREPWRNAFAWLDRLFGFDAARARWPQLAALDHGRSDLLKRMIERGINAPPAVSAGRLFDAVAAVAGIRADAISFEGQAAIELEALAARAGADGPGYPLPSGGEPAPELDFAPFWTALMDDLAAGADAAVVAARFHAGLADGIAALAQKLAGPRDLETVVLSGGVFQNALLRRLTAARLQETGLDVLAPVAFPAGDGGIALGQAAIALATAGRTGPGDTVRRLL